jgi:hypothetical protein
VNEEQAMLRFVHGGRQNLCDAIRAAVEKKYAKRLKAASAGGRKILLGKIEAEVRATINRKAPPGALY